MYTNIALNFLRVIRIAVIFEALVVRLYALGELSSGEGAKLLGLTRREFLDLLGQYNVSLFDNEIDLKKEVGYG